MRNIRLLGLLYLIIMGNEGFGQCYWAKGMGGTGNDIGYSVATDQQDNVFTAGSFSGISDFDPNAGILNLTSAGSSDVFITKLSASGSIVWAKKIGGTGNDFAFSIVNDAFGNIFISGIFNGTVDFDPGAGVSNLVAANANEIFICKLDNNGNFLWSKKFTGSSGNTPNSITLDNAGNLYITGSFIGTTDFNPAATIFNLISAGVTDIFICKLDNNGNFIWAKKYGGTGIDAGTSLCIDNFGNIYATGCFSGSVAFPSSFSATSVGGTDIYVLKINSSGIIIWGRAFGGTGNDGLPSSITANMPIKGSAIKVDGNGNVYATGYFYSTVDFDPNINVYNLAATGINPDIFLSKLDNNGMFINAYKFGGGAGFDAGNALTVDNIGNVTIYGSYQLTGDFDPSVGTNNLTSKGSSDIFLCKIDSLGILKSAHTFGGSGVDVGSTFIIDNNGSILMTGIYADTADFDPNLGTYNLIGSTKDIFTVKLDFLGNLVPEITGGNVICPGDTLILSSSVGQNYLWNTGQTSQNILVTTGGNYLVAVTDNLGCTTISDTLSVLSVPFSTATNTSPYCLGNSINLHASGGGTYSWSGPGGFTSTSQNPIRTNATTSMSGTYSVTVTSNGCSSTATTMVTVNTNPLTPTVSVSGPLTFCQGGSVILTSSSATGGYTWSTGATTQSITVSSSGTYSVIVLNASGCTAASASKTVTVNPNSATPTITSNGPLTFCEGDSVVLSSNFPENSLHDNKWFNGTTSVGNISSITITTSGTYYVSHYYTPGTTLYCPAYSSTVTVTVLPRPNTPTITVNGPLIICTGSPVILNSSSNINNIWSNGATSPSITVYNSGNYFLQITDGVCTSLSSIPVTITAVNPPINPSITVNGSLTLCKGEMVQLISNQMSNVLWSNGETTPYIDVYEPGSYLVSVSNGVCPTLTSSPVLISVNNLDAIISTSGQLAENSPNTSITFTANSTNAGSTSTYQWYKNGLPVGSNSATYTNNNWVNGEKIICRVTSSSGCSVYSNDLFVWLAQTTSDSWQRMADVGLDKNMVTPLFPTRIGAVSFVIGDKIYVGLGYDDKKGATTVPNAGYLSDFWEYNTITDEWTERAPFAFGNSPRMDAIAFVVNGRGYVGFGAGNGLYNDLWEYNPQTDSWIQKSNCPGIGRHSAVATNIGKSGYVGTGWGVNTYLNDWWKYTPATNSWSQLANYPFSYFGLNCASVNNRIYVSGTSSALTNAVSINYEYNPDNNTWSQKSPMPGNRYYSESFVINDTIFHCGGQSNPSTCQSAVAYDEVWAYYPPNDSWVQKSNVHFGKISDGCAASVNGYGYYISGGYNPVCQASSGWNYDGYGRETNLKYSPHTDSWEVKAVHGGLKKYFGFSTTIGDKGFALFQYSGLTGNTLTNMDIFEVYLYEYDPLNNIWKQKSKYPGQGIYQPGNGFSINGKIYYGSGSSSNNVYVNDFWEYNPVTNTWTNIGNVPISSSKGFSFVINGKGYIGGSQMGTSFFEFNPAFYSWIQRASIPALSSGNINFSLNNLGYTNLGTSSTAGSLHKYDPSINIWSFVNTLPNYSASVASNYFSFQTSSKGYYGTAINSSTSLLTTSYIYEFNPLNNSWVQKQTLSENHSTGGTFSFPNNSYVFSGNQYYPPHTASINSMWQYKTDYANITSTFNESNLYKQRFNIFPNPTTSIINVEKTEDIGISEISIYDLLGRKLSAMTPGNNSVIQIEMPLMPGTYYLKIEDENGKRDFFKVLKI